MRASAHLSRAMLGAAVLVLGVLLPSPAYAAPSSCTTVRGTGSCVFSCQAGDLITVDAIGSDGTGSTMLSGNAICGGVVAHCHGAPACHGEATARNSDDAGVCDLAGSGAVQATCTASDPGANRDLCDLVESPCTVFEGLNSTACPLLGSLSPGVAGVADITPEGDVTIVGVGPFWDCPPYGT